MIGAYTDPFANLLAGCVSVYLVGRISFMVMRTFFGELFT